MLQMPWLRRHGFVLKALSDCRFGRQDGINPLQKVRSASQDPYANCLYDILRMEYLQDANTLVFAHYEAR